MARNKYPEETIRRIVEVSTQLFVQQGYDNTSIQDIIDNLGGLSKGAIYHHFRSKQEILDAVTNYIYRDSQASVEAIIADKSLTGIEKLRKMIDTTLSDQAQEQVMQMGIRMMDNPQMLAMQLRDSVELLSRQLLLPVVLEGIADGSLGGLQCPQQFTEAFMLLTNVWLNPMVFLPTPEEVERRCYVVRALVRGMGIEGELLSDYTVEQLKRHVTAMQIAGVQK